MMATNVATGLEIEGEDHIRPEAWDEWLTLGFATRRGVRTVRGACSGADRRRGVNYAKAPRHRPSSARDDLGARRRRLPVDRQVSWAAGGGEPGPRPAALARWKGHLGESGLVRQRSERQRKADRLPHEAGLKLLSVPHDQELPVSALIQHERGRGLEIVP